MIVKLVTEIGTEVLFTKVWNKNEDISEETPTKRDRAESSTRRERNTLRFNDDNPLVIEERELAAIFHKKGRGTSNPQNSLYMVNGKRFIGTPPKPNVQEDEEEDDIL